jgi:hypothetical protein
MRQRADQRTHDLFDFELASRPSSAPGALAGLKTQIAHMMSAAIRNSGRDRHDIAASMSKLLGEDVSKTMLDAYTAESRDDQNVPAYRFLPFVFATESWPEFDTLLRPIGCSLLIGDAAKIAAVTELEIRRDQLDARIREMKRRIKATTHG